MAPTIAIQPITSRWFLQVFGRRGIPMPLGQQVQRLIDSLDATTHERLYSTLVSIEAGVEASAELEWVRALLDTAGDSGDPGVGLDGPVSHGQELLAEQHDDDRSGQSQERMSHHIYGSKAALTVEVDALRVTNPKQRQQFSVLIEAAPAVALRKYAWDRKIQFQITKNELPLLACSLLGWLESPLEINNHGPRADKSLHIADQGERYFVKLQQGPKSYAVPVGPSDVHAWTALVIEAMNRNNPSIHESMQLAMLRKVAVMSNPNKLSAKA